MNVNMRKILIVDDEQIVRVGLTSMINWPNEGYELLPPAKNGEEAISLLATYQPDILITDLDMPIMHGLDLIRYFKEHYPSIKIIVLSNHGDFELVHQAMSLGVYDFILKVTMTPDKLIDMVNRAALTLPELTPTPSVSSPIDLKQLFFDICYEHINHDDLLLLNGFGEKYNNLIYMSLDADKLLHEKKSIPSYSFLENSLINFIRETFASTCTTHFFKVDNTHFLLILSHHDHDYSMLEDKCSQLLYNIEIYANLSLYVAISTPFTNSESLYMHFKACSYTLDMNFYDSTHKIKHEDLTLLTPPNQEIISKSFKDQIRYSILDFNFPTTYQLISELFIHIKTCRPLPILVNHDLSDFLRSLLVYFNYPLDIDEAAFKLLLSLSKSSTLACYCDTFYALLEKLFNYVIPLQSHKYRNEVCCIMEYINNNITAKLTLSMIAKKVNMNESYVSRIFKKDTGITLVTYINNMKMQQAKELLKNSSFMIKDVSNVLGFENQFYFNKIFKKHFGINPSSFQKDYLSKLNL